MAKKANKFLNRPDYPGGAKELNKFISENLKYPDEALQNKISGSVHLEYVVNDEGCVETVKVLRGLGFGCDEEAVRVVKLLKYGGVNNRGMRLKTTKKITINFNLAPQIQNAEAPQTISYNYVSENKPTNNSYNIKITIENQSAQNE